MRENRKHGDAKDRGERNSEKGHNKLHREVMWNWALENWEGGACLAQ